MEHPSKRVVVVCEGGGTGCGEEEACRGGGQPQEWRGGKGYHFAVAVAFIFSAVSEVRFFPSKMSRPERWSLASFGD